MKKFFATLMVIIIFITGCGSSGSKQSLSFGTSQIDITTDSGYEFDVSKGVLTNGTLAASISFISGDTMSSYISTLISYAAKNYFVDAKKAADTHGNTRIYYICSHDGKTYYEGILWIENSDVGVFLKAGSSDAMSAFDHIQFKVASSSNPITAASKLNSLFAYIMGDVGTKTQEESIGNVVEGAISQGEEKSSTAASSSLVTPVDTAVIHKSDLENVASLYSLNLVSDGSTDELTELIKYRSEDEKTIVNYVVPKDEKTVKAMYKALIEGMGCTGDTNPIAEMVQDGSVTTYNFAFYDDTAIITVRSEDKTICDGIMACFGYRYDIITSDVSLDKSSIVLPSDTTTATLEGTQATRYFLGDPVYAAGNIQTKIDDTDKQTLEKALSILEKAIEKEDKFSDNCVGYFTMDADSTAFNEVESDTAFTFPAMIFLEDQKCYAQINITVNNLSQEKQKAINCIPKSYSLY